MRLNKGLIVACLMFGLPDASFAAKFNQDDLFKTVPSQSQSKTMTPASKPAATSNAAGAFANTVSSIKETEQKVKACKFLPIANAKIAEEPNNAQYYLARAQIYKDLEDYQLSLRDANRAIALKPSDQQSYAFRAAVFSQIKDWSSALADIDKALAIGPHTAELFQVKASDLMMLGRYKESLLSADKSIEMDQNCADCYALRGSVLFRLKDYKRAASDLQKAELLDPANIIAKTLRKLLDDEERALGK
ncbi:MAG: tetratricopeptide repeat protein [Candidatus Obscuribacterales bacterium]